MMVRSMSVAVLVCGASVIAQPAITIEVEDSVLLPGESTVVRLFAGFGSTDYAMASVITDFVTSVGSEGWSNPMLLEPMHRPATSVGVPSATGYDGIVANQLNHPLAEIFADPTNPMAFWQATYTAPVDPASPFDIDLSTLSSRYDVFIAEPSTISESRLAELVEGSATIRVIPAPASAAVLLFGAVALRRRR